MSEPTVPYYFEAAFAIGCLVGLLVLLVVALVQNWRAKRAQPKPERPKLRLIVGSKPHDDPREWSRTFMNSIKRGRQ